MKNKDRPKKEGKKQKAKKEVNIDFDFTELRRRNQYRVNPHLKKYFRMTEDDIKELEGRLHEIYVKSNK